MGVLHYSEMKKDSLSIAIASLPRPFPRLKERKLRRRNPYVRQKTRARGTRTNYWALHTNADAKNEEPPVLQSQAAHEPQQAQRGIASSGEALVPNTGVSKGSLASDSAADPAAKAPMKQELTRAEGNRVFTGPWSLKSRGLPRRKLPHWMLRKSADHDLPAKPVRGKRAYVEPSQSDVTESEEEAAQPLMNTLILPGTIPFRKYLSHRLLIFNITNSVTVRRLREAPPQKRSIAIAAGVGATVLLGLVLVACAGYFYVLDGPKAIPEGSRDPALSNSPRTDHSSSTRSRVAGEQNTPVNSKSTAPEATVELPLGRESAKAGSVAKSKQDPMPSPIVDLDEQQRVLEGVLEQRILDMRMAGANATQYVRENEAAILKLKHDVQELVSIRSGSEFSKSPQALALSRSLASVYLLIGQRQAARNLLLDLQETSGATRSKDDPEMRLLDHLLHLMESVPAANEDGSATTASLLTPSEIRAFLTKL